MRAFPWRPSLGRGAGGLAPCQNVPMLPKPLQFVLLLGERSPRALQRQQCVAHRVLWITFPALLLKKQANAEQPQTRMNA